MAGRAWFRGAVASLMAALALVVTVQLAAPVHGAPPYAGRTPKWENHLTVPAGPFFGHYPTCWRDWPCCWPKCPNCRCKPNPSEQIPTPRPTGAGDQEPNPAQPPSGALPSGDVPELPPDMPLQNQLGNQGEGNVPAPDGLPGQRGPHQVPMSPPSRPVPVLPPGERPESDPLPSGEVPFTPNLPVEPTDIPPVQTPEGLDLPSTPPPPDGAEPEDLAPTGPQVRNRSRSRNGNSPSATSHTTSSHATSNHSGRQNSGRQNGTTNQRSPRLGSASGDGSMSSARSHSAPTSSSSTSSRRRGNDQASQNSHRAPASPAVRPAGALDAEGSLLGEPGSVLSNPRTHRDHNVEPAGRATSDDQPQPAVYQQRTTDRGAQTPSRLPEVNPLRAGASDARASHSGAGPSEMQPIEQAPPASEPLAAAAGAPALEPAAAAQEAATSAAPGNPLRAVTAPFKRSTTGKANPLR